MALPISRRQFIGLSIASALGAGGYGFVRFVQEVRDAARRTSDL